MVGNLFAVNSLVPFGTMMILDFDIALALDAVDTSDAWSALPI